MSLPTGPALRTLCHIEDIPDGAARGFAPAPGSFIGLFAVRQGARVHVYLNACPHIGVGLDWMPDKFLSADGSHIVCSTHGAGFAITDGLCFAGPCQGDSLEAVEVTLKDGLVLVPADAGL